MNIHFKIQISCMSKHFQNKMLENAKSALCAEKISGRGR